MTKTMHYIFILILIFALYHTVRDVLQIFGVQHWTVNILAEHKHDWCKPVCNYYTLPWDIFVLIGSVVVLNKDRSGLLGKAILFSFIIWPTVWFLNWFLG